MNLDQNEIYRYARQFPVIGIEGQEKLKAAKVICVGAGGLGCPTLLYLASAGIGHITVVDGDTIERSNLQRQILYREADIGKSKVEVAIAWLRQLNSAIKFVGVNKYIDENNVAEIIQNANVVVDGSDNFQTRYLLNRYCRKEKIPLVSASIFQFEAQISTFNLNEGPCYECLYPTMPSADTIPNCALGGVLGVLPGVVGSLQAAEVIKLITGIGATLSKRLLCVNLRNMQFKEYSLLKHKNCSRDSCSIQDPLLGKSAIANEENGFKAQSIKAAELVKLQRKGKKVLLLDVRETFERAICALTDSLAIPLPQLETRLAELPKEQPIIVYCKSGKRGDLAAKKLLAAGFPTVFNLEGGILAWIREIDQSLMSY